MPHANALQLGMSALTELIEIALGKMTAQTAVLLEDANGGAAVVVLHALAQRLLQLLLIGTTVGARRGGGGMEAIVPAEHLIHECLGRLEIDATKTHVVGMHSSGINELAF